MMMLKKTATSITSVKPSKAGTTLSPDSPKKTVASRKGPSQIAADSFKVVPVVHLTNGIPSYAQITTPVFFPGGDQNLPELAPSVDGSDTEPCQSVYGLLDSDGADTEYCKSAHTLLDNGGSDTESYESFHP